MNRIIHPAGQKLVFTALSVYLVLAVASILIFNHNIWFLAAICFFGLAVLIIFLFFFRNPPREIIPDMNKVFAPADGTIVAIEEVFENEAIQRKCLEISIFMSIYNMHVNRYPVSGVVKYVRYSPGKYLVAYHPKSSELNEHYSTLVETPEGYMVLIKQIAGSVARRIVCYAKTDGEARQGSDLGFIKFGSRVDIFLPLDFRVRVKLYEKVKGNITIIATTN